MLFTNFEKFLKNKRGAIHVGANDGAERVWYQKQKISPVLWFEPNTEVFLRLQENIKRIENYQAYNIGIHDTLKTAILHIASNKGQSSSLLPFGTHSNYRPDITFVRDETIQLVRMDDFIKEKQIDITKYNFLNLDVQGVELNVLKSFGDLITSFDYIYTEVNEEELYKGGCLISQIDTYLKEFGFERKLTYMTKYKWGDAFYIKKSLLA
jgi:FkbM family methyltransferase